MAKGAAARVGGWCSSSTCHLARLTPLTAPFRLGLLQETENGTALHGAIIASQTARDILRAASTTLRRPSSFAPKSFARRTRTYSRPSGRRTTAASCWTDEVEPVLWPTTVPDCGWRPAGVSSLRVWPWRDGGEMGSTGYFLYY